MKLTDKKFADLDVPQPLRDGLNELGFEFMTEVQAASIPLSLTGKDVAAQAQTGSGKTAAFLVTIFNHILTKPRRKTRGVCPRAIIITPTRELAVQVAKDAEAIGKYLDLKIRLAYGGVDYQKQRDAIKDGVDLLVGTPGRLIDYLKQRIYHLEDVELAVIDEADRMFDMGFVDDIRFMMQRMSAFDKRQSMLYSATLSLRVRELAYEHMNMPEHLEVAADSIVADKVEQVLYHLGSSEKISFLLGYLEKEEWEKAIIFINTKRMGNKLMDYLNFNGYISTVLSGDVSQERRLKVLKRFTAGEIKILVATDVASRGLHIPGVTHVFNFDLPQDCEDYVHRIGRTARAGASGKAVTFACEDYVFSLGEIEEFIGKQIPSESPPLDYFIDVKKPPYKPRPKTDGPRSGGGRGGPGSGRGGPKSSGSRPGARHQRSGRGGQRKPGS